MTTAQQSRRFVVEIEVEDGTEERYYFASEDEATDYADRVNDADTHGAQEIVGISIFVQPA